MSTLLAVCKHERIGSVLVDCIGVDLLASLSVCYLTKVWQLDLHLLRRFSYPKLEYFSHPDGLESTGVRIIKAVLYSFGKLFYRLLFNYKMCELTFEPL